MSLATTVAPAPGNFVSTSRLMWMSKAYASCKCFIIAFVPFGPHTGRGVSRPMTHPVSHQNARSEARHDRAWIARAQKRYFEILPRRSPNQRRHTQDEGQPGFCNHFCKNRQITETSLPSVIPVTSVVPHLTFKTYIKRMKIQLPWAQFPSPQSPNRQTPTCLLFRPHPASACRGRDRPSPAHCGSSSPPRT